MPASRDVPGSKFVYVILTARRARQLMCGAPPLLMNPRLHKPTRIAQYELEKGLLEYEMPEPSEGSEEKEGKRRKP